LSVYYKSIDWNVDHHCWNFLVINVDNLNVRSIRNTETCFMIIYHSWTLSTVLVLSILLLSNCCGRVPVYNKSLSKDSIFSFSNYWIMHIIWTCTQGTTSRKGHIFMFP
jgi:hypothetical protein